MTVRTKGAQSRRRHVDGGHATSDSVSGDAGRQLASIVTSAATHDAACRGFVGWIGKQPRVAATGFFVAQPDGSLVCGPNTFDGPAFADDAFRTDAQICAIAAAHSGTTQTVPVEKVRNVTLVGVPVSMEGQRPSALVAAMVVQPGETPEAAFLQTAAAYATLWQASHKQNTTDSALAATAATLDLLSLMAGADSLNSGGISMVNALREHLQCRAVVLGLTRRQGPACRVAAISGLSEFDRHATFTQTIEEALEECLVRDGLAVFPTDDVENRDRLLAHRKLCHDLQAARLISFPLKDSRGTVVGAWLTVDDAESSRLSTTPILLKAAAPRIADGINVLRRADSSLFGNRPRDRSSLRWLIRGAIAAGVSGLILMVPVPYRIHCECSAEPDVRRFIVAPHEGLVEKTFVEPGDVVKTGTLLARMDGRDVRWELAGLTAEREKTARDRDAGLIDGDAAAAQRASLELKRIEAKQRILTRRRDQLELTSPIDGIVLDGHLDRVENAPVTIGQALYEVAPLSPVTVEIAIPDDEFTRVEAGFEVAVRFDGIDEEFTGTIERIHPRTEIRDGHNVFVAEIILTNNGEQLRPGMHGYARVKGRTKSLGWNLFHKPWEHLRKCLPF